VLRFQIVVAGVCAPAWRLRPGLRDGVITPAPPWMTAENPASAEPRAFPGTMEFHGLQKIAGTGRLVPASRPWTAEHFEHRAEHLLVPSDRKADQAGDGAGDHRLVRGGRSCSGRARDQPEAARLFEPVVFQLGEIRLGRARAGDGDQIPLVVGKVLAMLLDDRPEPSA